MNPNTLTPAQKMEYRFFYDAVRKLDYDLRHEAWLSGSIPMDWKALLQEDGRPDKERVTIRLDADMVKFFRRRWGRGYQAEVNRVLRAFFKFHLSRIVKGDDGFERLLAEAQTERRPESGDAERDLQGKLLFGGLGTFAEKE